MLLSNEDKRMGGCLINSGMTPHCKCVGGSGKNSNELVKAEVEEKAETSLQLKDRASSGSRRSPHVCGLGNHDLGAVLQKSSRSSTSPQAACESPSSSSGCEESNCISSGWTKRKKKEEAILPTRSGPQPHVYFRASSLQSLQGKQEGPWAGQSGEQKTLEVGL